MILAKKSMLQSRVAPISIHKVSDEQVYLQHDLLVVEEPLEIRLVFGERYERKERALAVTMRTPGHDFELALGFLLTEGIINGPDELENIRYCVQIEKPEAEGNVLRVSLKPGLVLDWELLQRNFYTTSSCGVCGKSSIEAIQVEACIPIMSGVPKLSTSLIHKLSHQLKQAQAVFTHTGGLHAAALFTAEGELLMLREDIGRHNAVDKLIGAAAQQKVALSECLLFLSGRAGFELLQKARMAGIPVIAAVGAPSSLAVSLAREAGITLIGFVRDQRYNVYTGLERMMGMMNS